MRSEGAGVGVDPQEFRTVIGHLATGVTVITTAAGEKLQGMTANAVTSLSLEPVMVLICVDKSTHTHPLIEQSGVFVVNILAEHQEETSRLFAKRAEPEIGTLRGAAFRIGVTGAPILEDCLAYVECRVAGAFAGGDHTIFLGEVVTQALLRETAAPLLFFRGRYGRLAG